MKEEPWKKEGAGRLQQRKPLWRMDGLHPILRLSLFLLAAASFLGSTTAEDRLATGRHLSQNERIVSAGGIFALGFFSPGRATDRRYVGIWYNNIPGKKTVVWVANRENPLMDSGGVFTVAEDGNIVLLNGKGGLLWSSNVSEVHRNAVAVLLDTGNLELRGAQGEDDFFWQSFDHPADTILPEMKMRLTVKTRAHTLLVSWRAADDPSPGNFSVGFDPETQMQIKIWRGSETWYRGRRLWNGNQVVTVSKTVSNTTSILLNMPEINSEEMSICFTVAQGTPPFRNIIDPTGSFRFLRWESSSAKWSPVFTLPGNPCDIYNRCGPSGLCSTNGTSLECSCLKGFVPFDQKGWIQGNFSGGCVRRMPLQCDRGDWFLRLENIKLPDRFVLIRNVDAQNCEAECMRRCNCTAYSYSDMTSDGSSAMCLVWSGELLDLGTPFGDTSPVYELNVRLVQYELDDSSKKGGFLKKKSHLLAITFAALGALMLLLGILSLLLKGKRKNKNAKLLIGDIMFPRIIPNGENIGELPLLHFSSVQAATENFSPANKLGEGGFGSVYKGKFPHGEVAAVKRLSKCSGQGSEEFKNEVELIARLQHKNIVQLLGWCLHEDEKILVYEYLPNRSLDKFIFDSSRAVELDWERRFHIIKGIAHGLLYLHQHSRLHVVHRDLKTSNILLDGAMNAKISDFGLARMVKENQKEENTTRIVGTYGYMSPEYAVLGHFSEKSDVYSFGVILLEIISGRRNNGVYPYMEALSLLEYAWKLWNADRGLELMDPSFCDSCRKEEVSRCIHVSLMCVQEAATARPTTSEILGMLGADKVSLPDPKQPAFLTERDSYLELPANGSINFMTISTVDGR